MSDPRIVVIETSTRSGSVAVAIGANLCAETHLGLCGPAVAPTSPVASIGGTGHAADLFPAIDRLWTAQGWPPDSLQQVHVSIGPGSFTGLRVAVTVARHLSLACGAAIVAVPTLDVIAYEAEQDVPVGGHLAVILDAKRGQVFGGIYRREAGGFACVQGPVLVAPDELLARIARPAWVTGEGVTYHRAAVQASGAPAIVEERRIPRARTVHRLGWALAQRGAFTAARELIPRYVRIPEPEEKLLRRAGSPA